MRIMMMIMAIYFNSLMMMVMLMPVFKNTFLQRCFQFWWWWWWWWSRWKYMSANSGKYKKLGNPRGEASAQRTVWRDLAQAATGFENWPTHPDHHRPRYHYCRQHHCLLHQRHWLKGERGGSEKIWSSLTLGGLAVGGGDHQHQHQQHHCHQR